MEILSKVWYKNFNVKEKYYREYKLNLNREEEIFLMDKINSNDLESIKRFVKSGITISSDKLKSVNCINGCIDKNENKIVLLSNVYVTDCFFRLLKIEKLLYGE